MIIPKVLRKEVNMRLTFPLSGRGFYNKLGTNKTNKKKCGTTATKNIFSSSFLELATDQRPGV